jgi:hypothetical protein
LDGLSQARAQVFLSIELDCTITHRDKLSLDLAGDLSRLHRISLVQSHSLSVTIASTRRSRESWGTAAIT